MSLGCSKGCKCGDERRNTKNISLDEEEVQRAVCSLRCSNGTFLLPFLFNDPIMDTSEKPGVIIHCPHEINSLACKE